jgi:hypothetical protein
LALLGISPKGLKTRIQKDIHISVSIETLFTTSERWEQPKCRLVEEWILKMWYVHRMECYSALKWKENMTHITTWVNLRRLSEINQQKNNKGKALIITKAADGFIQVHHTTFFLFSIMFLKFF